MVGFFQSFLVSGVYYIRAKYFIFQVVVRYIPGPTDTHPYESSSRAESHSLSYVHYELDCAHSTYGTLSYDPLHGGPMHGPMVFTLPMHGPMVFPCMHQEHCRLVHSFR